MVAGAKSLLTSLWQVDDLATQEFFKRYYSRLSQGVGRGDALIQTQRDFQQGIAGQDYWSEPYYWAGWNLVGATGPVKFGSNN